MQPEISLVEPQWRLKKFSIEKVQQAIDSFGLSQAAAKTLLANEIEDQISIKNFLKPNLDQWIQLKTFPSMTSGVEKLIPFLQEKKKVCIHGDFDTDGVLATVILKQCFAAIDIEPICYIPTREEGHGISASSVSKIAEMGAEVIITVDCGTAAIDAAEEAKKHGIELFITDHHLPDETLPDATAIINPQIDDDPAYQVLSGSGVSLKLGLICANRLKKTTKHNKSIAGFLPNGIVLAAIATIGDVVPLTGENRALVKAALKMAEKITWPNLKILFEASGIKAPFLAEHLAFQLIPRLNAAQRLEKGELVWQFFNSTDDKKTRKIGKELSELNEHRKQYQKEKTSKIMFELSQKFKQEKIPDVIFVKGDDWIEGISGLIASRVTETYQRPTVVTLFKGEYGQASLRAPEGYHLKEALDKSQDNIITYGGHRGAAGMKIHTEAVSGFEKNFSECIRNQRATNEEQGLITNPTLMITHEVEWTDINHALIDELEQFEPYGHCNKKPIFACRALQIDGSPHYLGKDRSHVRLSFYKTGKSSIESIGFSLAEKIKHIDIFNLVDVAFHLGRNKYGKRIQLQLLAIRQHIQKK